jgi:hypothetical protein
MPKPAANKRTAATPRGARFHTFHRTRVSEGFIRSLDDDGVSRETIRSIERENQRIAAERKTQGH